MTCTSPRHGGKWKWEVHAEVVQENLFISPSAIEDFLALLKNILVTIVQARMANL